jgi:periplasmic protein TonB
MPQEFLGDVFRTGDAPGRARRRLSILPLSIAAHALGGAAILIIPLAAEVELPAPMRPSIEMMEIVPAPLPPEPPVQRTQQSTTMPANSAAPIVAPSSISEVETPPGPTGPVIPGALPIGNGPDGAFTTFGSVTIAPPPPPPPSPEPRRPGGIICEPKKVFDVPPVYPQIAVSARKEGTVILEAVIDEAGNVARVKVLRSEPLLDQAAIDAVKRWRYTPTLLNNTPIPILMTITVRFTLRQ